MKDIGRAFCNALFRVLGVGLGIAILAIIAAFLFRKPPAPEHTTTATVLPNHKWEKAPLSSTAPTILQINIQGVIGLDSLNYHDVRDQLIDTINGEIKKEQVKAVLLYIDTTGGTADDSDNIYLLLKDYKARLKIPVYAYVNGFCASGGFYIACSADKIYATDASVIGSVGVVLPPIFNFSSLMERVGIESMTISAGKHKDSLNPFRPWKPNEGESYQQITNAFYNRFTSIVSENRPLLTRDVLVKIGANIFPTGEALKLGYIDEKITAMEDVLKRISSELGIEKNYQVVQLQSRNWFDELFAKEQSILRGKVEHTVQVPGILPKELQGRPLYLYQP